jgi:pimeloyl-ACP methyl ester carboxylesterase
MDAVRARAAAVAGALATSLAMGGTAVAAPAAEPKCRQIEIPVALGEGAPADQRIVGDLCEPTGYAHGTGPTTIQLLVHGITYNAGYWSFPDPTGGTDRYNYVAHALQAGFATLAIDRVGSTRSSKPPSEQLTIDSNAYSVHQVVQAIRSGAITRTDGATFSKVVYVGHSYGTWTGWFEVGRYNDVDAAVFTAASSKGAPTALANALGSLYPASSDPRFAGQGLDPGYLTTMPDHRYQAFYAPAEADPAVVAHDEETKATVTASELQNFRDILTTRQNIRVPVFLVAGTDDSLFCRENFGNDQLNQASQPAEDNTLLDTGEESGLRFGATRCDTPAHLIADEREHLGPNVPSIDAFILQGAGHDLNQAMRAPEFFDATQNWIRRHTAPGHRHADDQYGGTPGATPGLDRTRTRLSPAST